MMASATAPCAFAGTAIVAAAVSGTYVVPPAIIELDRARRPEGRSVRADPACRALAARTSSTRCSTTSTANGYGLTLGIHSRIDGTVDAYRRAARATAMSMSTAT